MEEKGEGWKDRGSALGTNNTERVEEWLHDMHITDAYQKDITAWISERENKGEREMQGSKRVMERGRPREICR